MRRFISQDRELCAGAAFVPAGYSSGRSVCARGGTVGAIRNAECAIRNFGNELIRRCGSIAVFRVWFTPAVRFCWDVWRSVHACRAVLLECLAFGSRLSLFLCQEKRDGLRYLAFLFRRGSESPLVRSRMPCGYRTSPVHFGIVRFFAAIPTETPKKSRRRSESLLGGGQALNRSHIPAP